MAAKSSKKSLQIGKTEKNICTYQGEEKKLNISYYDTKLHEKYPQLESIEVAENNPYYSSKNGILYTKNGETLLYCPPRYDGLVRIDKNVKSIGYHAFEGCMFITGFDVDNDNMFYSSNNGVLMNKEGTWLIAFPSKQEGQCIITANIERIFPIAFSNSQISELIFLRRENDVRIASFTFAEAGTGGTIKNVIYEDNADQKIKPWFNSDDNDGAFGSGEGIKFSHVKEYVQSNLATTEPVQRNNESSATFSWWYYILGAILIVGILFFIYKRKR